MHLATVGWLLGAVWVGLAGVLTVPLVTAAVLDEPWQPFAIAVATALVLGAALMLRLRDAEPSLSHREAFLAVSLVWLSVCAIGAIPYATYPEPQLGLVDAMFESVSGFTTTGATVLSGLDALPRSFLLWRSITQWLGGMGMVIFGVAILPLLGVGGMQLYKAEAPGPTKDKMTPRIAETAKLLWLLYLGLTVTTGVVFFWQGMTAFDAINHAMTAIATGGFSTHDQSLGFFDSSLIRASTVLTMLVGGTSFAILHRVLVGRGSWSDQPELRAYIGIFCLATALMTADLMISMSDRYASFGSAFEHAAFQAASILTTTGYTTTDYDLWPAASHVVLLALCFCGGMAGSTSGGLKVIRALLMIRVALMQFFKLVHRHAVDPVRLGAQTIDDRVLSSSLGFIMMWAILLAVGTLALAAAGTDLVSCFSAAAVSLGNIGPGIGAIGPSHTFAAFDEWSKLVMQALMILGRLEIYTVLIVLTPSFWRL